MIAPKRLNCFWKCDAAQAEIILARKIQSPPIWNSAAIVLQWFGVPNSLRLFSFFKWNLQTSA